MIAETTAALRGLTIKDVALCVALGFVGVFAGLAYGQWGGGERNKWVRQSHK